ncbi:MAG: ABC transporter permease [Rickettsiales bacterium]
MAFSPLTQKRFSAFRRNKRGMASLMILLALAMLCACAELLANDKPVAVRYKGEWLFPAFKEYPETRFGGFIEAEADYKDPYVADMIIGEDKTGVMLWPPLRFGYNTINYRLSAAAPTPPDNDNWLGTDDRGRDVLSNLIYGTRTSLIFGLAVTMISSVVGVAAGAVQGYFGGKIDLFFQRLIEMWTGLPELFVLIIVSGMTQPNMPILIGLISLFGWPRLTGPVRAEFLKARNLPYVTAAKTLGVKEKTIIFRHILPNAAVSALTYIPFVMTGTIALLTVLDFLGFGMPPSAPSLGKVLSQGKNNLHAPWIGLSVFFTLASLLTLMLFVGEAVRDAFDPRRESAIIT